MITKHVHVRKLGITAIIILSILSEKARSIKDAPRSKTIPVHPHQESTSDRSFSEVGKASPRSQLSSKVDLRSTMRQQEETPTCISVFPPSGDMPPVVVR